MKTCYNESRRQECDKIQLKSLILWVPWNVLRGWWKKNYVYKFKLMKSQWNSIFPSKSIWTYESKVAIRSGKSKHDEIH